VPVELEREPDHQEQEAELDLEAVEDVAADRGQLRARPAEVLVHEVARMAEEDRVRQQEAADEDQDEPQPEGVLRTGFDSLR
jgi:hypothetical protein